MCENRFEQAVVVRQRRMGGAVSLTNRRLEGPNPKPRANMTSHTQVHIIQLEEAEPTCYNARSNSSQERGLGTSVDPGQDAEQQPILRHGVDNSGHGKH